MKIKSIVKVLSIPLILFGLYFTAILLRAGINNFVPITVMDTRSDRLVGIIDGKSKGTTNLLIIHGIGNHCIGYADAMVSSLVTAFKEKKWIDSRHGYADFLTNKQREIVEKVQANGSLRVSKLYAPRNGMCEVDYTDSASIDLLKKLVSDPKTKQLVNNPGIILNPPPDNLFVQFGKYISRLLDDSLIFLTNLVNSGEVNFPHQPIDKSFDLEAIVSGQEDLCKNIHALSNNTIDNVSTDCFRLSVNDKSYTTGFIRKITSPLTALERLNIYEITWTPAVRWLKSSFMPSERVNENLSYYLFNKNIKEKVVNDAIADAVAYLSDNGILINYDILQGFCMSLATPNNDTGLESDFDFVCNKEILKSAPDNFSLDNEVIFISHSLGSRILFDSLGLLASGAKRNPADDRPTLMGVMDKKFKTIGAEIPSSFTNPSNENEMGFVDLLHSRIPDYIKSIRSIYLLTNQIPLLYANVTSPLRPRIKNVSYGFDDFIETRDEYDVDHLKIVSFHDPDDALSYDLKCWFHMNILKNLEATKDTLWRESQSITNSDDKEIVGTKYRELREEIFSTCFREDLPDNNYRLLYDTIWRKQAELFDLVDATVRINSFRLPLFLADPGGIHSNYFIDKNIHKWILNGNN